MAETKKMPPHVHAQRRDNGRMRYYYQLHRGTDKAGSRVRLPDDPASPEFLAAYEAARLMRHEATGKPDRRHPYTRYQRSVDVPLLLRGARQRAKENDVPYDLTDEHILDLMDRQKMRCAVTGIPMSGRAKDDPFAWSIDRIHGPTGYVQGNVRLVCRITNMAMNQWGEETLLQFIRMAYISTVTGKKLLPL